MTKVTPPFPESAELPAFSAIFDFYCFTSTALCGAGCFFAAAPPHRSFVTSFLRMTRLVGFRDLLSCHSEEGLPDEESVIYETCAFFAASLLPPASLNFPFSIFNFQLPNHTSSWSPACRSRIQLSRVPSGQTHSARTRPTGRAVRARDGTFSPLPAASSAGS